MATAAQDKLRTFPVWLTLVSTRATVGRGSFIVFATYEVAPAVLDASTVDMPPTGSQRER